MSTAVTEISPEAIPKEVIERFMPYLSEVRRKLFFTGVIFLIATGAGFYYYQKILLTLMGFFDLEGIQIVLTSPYQFFSLALSTGITVGLAFTLPLIAHHFMSFIKPALRPQEFRILYRALPLSFILLIAGFAFGIWIMNFVINLFQQTTLDFSVSNVWDISQFFTQILFTAISLALVFQFPLFLVIAMKFGLIERQKLTRNRPIIYATALVFAAILPPTDPFSLALMTIPLIFLFEFALLINKAGYFG